jgi:HSP20 family protein
MSELFGELGSRLRGDRWQPVLDVFETEKSIVVRVELAGVRRDDLQVSVDGDVLRVRGVRRPPSESDVERLHRMEIAFGPFERTLSIPVPFEREQVAAHLADGFLRVTLPKRVAAKRAVEVEHS